MFFCFLFVWRSSRPFEKNVFFVFSTIFFEANFLTKEQAETIDLLVFFVARVPRRDLSLLMGIHVFNQFCNVVDHGAAPTGLHFGRHLDANLGGARSQRSMGFSSFDARKKHVRETPKNQTSTRYNANPPPARCRHFGVRKRGKSHRTIYFL